MPHLSGCTGSSGQKAADAIMADESVQQRRQPGCRCLPKRTDQIVTVEVEHLSICHRLECTTLFDSLVRKVSP